MVTSSEPVDVPSTADSPNDHDSSWLIYRGTGELITFTERDRRWPPPPHWRDFGGGPDLASPEPDVAETNRRLGDSRFLYRSDPEEIAMVNAAIYLRRPLLVTGRPGSGKSSLAYRIARELQLGPVLRWPVTSRTTLRSGQYEYDAIGRAQAAGPRYWPTPAVPGMIQTDGNALDQGLRDEAWLANRGIGVGDFLQLGALGTAFLPYAVPRVLLIDEMDKGDFDLPNDLLNIFEEGEFEIPELVRLRGRLGEVMVHTADRGVRAPIHEGLVRCHAFPIVVITSNGERDFPPAFLRRCLSLQIADPDADQLASMVAAHFPLGTESESRELITSFLDRSHRLGGLAADQLLNAVHLATSGAFQPEQEDNWPGLLEAIWNRLSFGAS